MRRDWKAARAKVDREGCCRVCGIGGRLEAAHIIPRSLGGEQREESIVPLCPACHRAYDGGRLDLLPYLTFEEQAEAVRVLGMSRAMRRISNEGRSE